MDQDLPQTPFSDVTRLIFSLKIPSKINLLNGNIGFLLIIKFFRYHGADNSIKVKSKTIFNLLDKFLNSDIPIHINGNEKNKFVNLIPMQKAIRKTPERLNTFLLHK